MMNIKRAISIMGLCFWALLGSVWAAAPTGAALCVTCHDSDDMPDMRKSAHAFSTDTRAPDCVSCHGASEAHATSKSSKPPVPDVTFNKVFGKNAASTTTDRSAKCQSCHDKDAKRAHWVGSQHQNSSVACDSCHKVHSSTDRALVKAAQAELCYACHKQQRAQLSRPSHHPIPEGKMVCTDCHNVHGSAGPKLLTRDSTNATCYTCHAEKRGPFVHQHDPVAEDCSNCHNPHGSVVEGMLKTRAPMLCQQCHTPHVAGSVGTIGAPMNALTAGKNSATLWQGKSCMNCHSQVHGSNNPNKAKAALPLLMR
jgi:DmsE family decaheme c-type cytochrome